MTSANFHVQGNKQSLSQSQSQSANASKQCTGQCLLMHQVLQKNVEAVQQSTPMPEQLLRAVVELTPLPIAITNAEGTQILFKNQLVEPFFGSSGEPLTSIEPWLHAHAADYAQVLHKLQSEGRITDYQLQIKTVDGELRDTLVSAQVVECNVQPAILWIWTDITEQIQQRNRLAEQEAAEAALRQSEAQFRAIAQVSPVPLTLSRVEDGLLLYTNEQARQTFGFSTEELAGRKTPNFYYDAIDCQKIIKRLLQEQYISSVEVQVRRANGTPFWVAASLQLLTFNGEPVVLSAFYDITERRQAEAAVQAQARQQAAIAQLGQQALVTTDLIQLFDQAVTLVSQALEIKLCGIWKVLPNHSTLLLQAGIGWQDGLVGSALTGIQLNSHLGYALHTQQPVLTEDFRVDSQFSGPPLLHNHRIVSGISIPISDQSQALGVLGCYIDQPRIFTQDELHFLQVIANILASVISRHQSEAQLHLMKQAIAASSNGVVITDAHQLDNPIIYVNPAFEAITGYAADEVIGQNCRFLQGGENQHAIEVLRSAIENSQECHVTLRNYRKDGTPFWNDLHIAPVFDAEGYLTHFVGVQTDITERIRSEELLRRQEEQYRRIVETATEGIWMLDADSNTSFVNQQTAMMMGYSPDEMQGKPLFSFMDEEGKTLASLYLERRRQGVHEMHDFKFRRKDGAELWVILSTSPLFDDQGNYVGALGMLTDITDRRRAEVALRESEQRLNGILRSLEDVVWSISATTHTTLYVNPAVEKIYSRSVMEFFNNPSLWMEVIHPDDQKRVQMAAQALRRKGSNEVEYRILQPDGNIRWLYERCHMIYNAAGQAVRIDGIATDITERKWMEAQLMHDAYHDALTGLPNRVLFMDRLKQAIARSKRQSDHLFAVLFLDLDRFKVINDSLGHLIGDQLLVAIAQRLAICLNANHTIARLGGDEFTILLDPLQDVKEVKALAERLHQSLKLPFNLNGYEVVTTASVGIALSVTGYDQPEDVLRDADAALYHAKGQGKACSAVFDAAMHNRAMSLLQLEMALRRAIDRQELQVYYQPIVSLTTGEINGFEALVRWLNSEQKFISPAEFIPVAEETGMIVPLGQWVLYESCQQLRRWQMQFPTCSNLTMSVNLSSKQFSQPDLVDQIAQVLREIDLNPSHLKLEITESGIMNNVESAALLRQLQALNVQLCIDDFGTGYSSLSRLRQFPINTLKIDRSFISTMLESVEDAEVVQAIITLAHNLSMDVVAEGIETAEQLAQLRQLHCEQGQGYFFSRPLNSQAVEALLAADCQTRSLVL